MKPVSMMAPKFEPCEQCSDGWKLLPDGSATRCWCWKKHIDDWLERQRKYAAERQGKK